MNDTKVAALFKPRTQKMHKELGQEVINLLQVHGALTRQRLASMLDKPINCVTAPIKQLLDAQIIVEHERVRDPITKCQRWTLRIKEQES